MGKNDRLDFSKDLTKTLGAAGPVPGAFEHAPDTSEAGLSFAQSLTVLAEHAIHMGYRREEVATVLKLASEQLAVDL